MTKINRNNITNVFDRDQEPVCHVEVGESLVFETLDAAAGKIRTVEDGMP